MNEIQRISQRLTTDRLKLQLGLSLDTQLDYWTLHAMNRRSHNERIHELARREAACLNAATAS